MNRVHIVLYVLSFLLQENWRFETVYITIHIRIVDNALASATEHGTYFPGTSMVLTVGRPMCLERMRVAAKMCSSPFLFRVPRVFESLVQAFSVAIIVDYTINNSRLTWGVSSYIKCFVGIQDFYTSTTTPPLFEVFSGLHSASETSIFFS